MCSYLSFNYFFKNVIFEIPVASFTSQMVTTLVSGFASLMVIEFENQYNITVSWQVLQLWTLKIRLAAVLCKF